MPTLLVIDDEASVRYSFQRVFEEGGVRVLTAGTAAEGLQQIRENEPDVIVLDLQLPDRSGLDLFGDLHALDPKRPVIFITAHGTTETAIEAMKNGAFDYLVKAVDLERVSQILERAFEAGRLMRVPAVLPAEECGDRIVGRSLLIQRDVQSYRSNRPSRRKRSHLGGEWNRQGTRGPGPLPPQPTSPATVPGN